MKITHLTLNRFAAATVVGSALAFTGLVTASTAPDTAISEQQAIDIAQQQVSGTLIGSELEKEKGQWVWEVEIETADKQEWELKIDAQTGEVLEQEQDD